MYLVIVNTRQLNVTDLETAIRLVAQFHGKTVSPAYMTHFLGNSSNFLLVAEEGDEVVGFLLAHQIDSLEREARAMFIYEVEVAETHRRQGVGTALINHIRNLAQADKMFEMFVFTNRSNAGACTFYHSTGGQTEEGDELMFVYYLPTAQG